MKQLFFLSMIIFFCSSCGYNKLVELDESVKSQWAQVENQYERRAELIPNLVATVKGAADFEKNTLEAVINARAKATSVSIDPSNLDAASIQKFQAAQNELSGALSKLLVVVEQYPELKANRGFLDLQAQLEGTENRIATERKRFNEAIQSYNSYRRKVPQYLTAGMFGFKEIKYFEAKEGNKAPPKVEF